MAKNFFKVKNGITIADSPNPQSQPPPAEEPGDLVVNGGSLYLRDNANWKRVLAGSVSSAEIGYGQVTIDKIADGAVTDGKVAEDAAIEGTKINPNFGAQNVQTTGSVSGNTISSTTTVSGTAFLGNAIGASGDTSMKKIYGYARIESPVQTESDAGNEIIDCSLKSIALKTGGTADITLDNLAEGQTFTLVVTSTGSAYTLTWSPTIKWPGGVVPSPTVTAASRDIYTFTKIGGEVFGTVAKDLR